MSDVAVTVPINEIEVAVAEAPEVRISLGDSPEVTIGQVVHTTDVLVNDVTMTVEVASPTVSVVSVPDHDEVTVALNAYTVDARVFSNEVSIDVGVGVVIPMEVIDFPAPTATWVIDVGRMVDVVVINSAGQVVWPGEIVYGPGTKVTMQFSFPFSGKVHCYS